MLNKKKKNTATQQYKLSLQKYSHGLKGENRFKMCQEKSSCTLGVPNNNLYVYFKCNYILKCLQNLRVIQ